MTRPKKSVRFFGLKKKQKISKRLIFSIFLFFSQKTSKLQTSQNSRNSTWGEAIQQTWERVCTAARWDYAGRLGFCISSTNYRQKAQNKQYSELFIPHPSVGFLIPIVTPFHSPAHRRSFQIRSCSQDEQ